ncbi:MAG TPA: toll/interleukin-1 receptor domain-containing protein [Hanamia sp.]
MKAFISYSHNGSLMLEMFHKHLAQLKRDGTLTTWTDQQIPSGSKLDQSISSELSTSNLFIALLSPDYISSKYCYEKEFQKALEMLSEGKIIIIPIIIEVCDWLSTPFKEFKALPRDGKAISTWENKNTAFLDVIQNVRLLIAEPIVQKASITIPESSLASVRNYRVQRDFDSIEKMEFVEKTFHEIKELLKRYIDEILQIDNIKARIMIDNKNDFECLLVNRNKIATESQLNLSIAGKKSGFRPSSSDEEIIYSININNRAADKSFTLALDDYHLFFIQNNFYSGSNKKIELGPKEISDMIWNELLESVGIM